eukprot:1151450-Pelagomonas_calceolata.AAC.5
MCVNSTSAHFLPTCTSSAAPSAAALPEPPGRQEDEGTTMNGLLMRPVSSQNIQHNMKSRMRTCTIDAPQDQAVS